MLVLRIAVKKLNTDRATIVGGGKFCIIPHLIRDHGMESGIGIHVFTAVISFRFYVASK